jgi:hypothetical protein
MRLCSFVLRESARSKLGDRMAQRVCRFEARCTNANCSFLHPSRDGPRAGVDAATSTPRRPHGPPVCRNEPRCSNATCTFAHPSRGGTTHPKGILPLAPSNVLKAIFAASSSKESVEAALKKSLADDVVSGLMSRLGKGVDPRGFCFLNFVGDGATAAAIDAKEKLSTNTFFLRGLFSTVERPFGSFRQHARKN